MWHRNPTVAGSFYPSNPSKLRAEIEKYISNAEARELTGELIALISPHAGYIYSGPVAAYSYAQLKGRGIETAVVLAPSHRARFDGASIIPAGEYETPLGSVIIDEKIGNELLERPGFNFIKEAHMYEHSLEVQVPFLQSVLDNFNIVPVVVGTTDITSCKDIADELYGVLKNEKRKYIIVLSTDLSHYMSYATAQRVDNVFIENLKKLDAECLSQVLNRDDAQACGEGPVLTGLMLSKKLGASRVEILKYANSGDTAGSRDQVVGYLSAAIVK